MRGLLTGCCVASLTLAAGCTTAYVPAQPAPGLAFPSSPQTGQVASDGWQPNERVVPANASSINPLPASRTGISPSGLVYRYYPDGSGSVRSAGGSALSGWDIDCGKDAMNDKRNCKVRSYDAKLTLLYEFGAAPKWVCIIPHDFPGRRGQIRVDSGKPLTTDTDGCVAGSFVSQLRNGTNVTVRYVEWPYDYNKDNTATLQGLSDALELVKFIRTNT